MTDAATADAPLYLTDKEIAGRIGVPVTQWEKSARLLEREGLPMRDPLFGNQRHWLAVRAFLDRRVGLAAPSVRSKPGGLPNWEGENVKAI